MSDEKLLINSGGDGRVYPALAIRGSGDDHEMQEYGSMSESKTSQAPVSGKAPLFRWVIYTMCSYQIFVQWFVLYSPSGLQAQFIDVYNLSYAEYALLFSIVTGPICVFPLFLGVVVDKLGVTYSAIISISILLLGNVLFVLSMYINTPGLRLVLMYVSRCFEGIGIVYYGVVNNAILHTYFHNAELAFSLGIGPIHSRTGLAAGQYLSFVIYSYLQTRVEHSDDALIDIMWFTAALCAIGLLFNSTVLLSQNSYIREQKLTMSAKLKNELKIKDAFKTYTMSFWTVIVIAGLGYLPFLGFMVTGSDALMSMYGYSQAMSNQFLLIPNASALIGCFLVGFLIDRFNRIPVYFLLSAVLYAAWHLFCLFVGSDASESMVIFMLCLFGFGFSCFATTMWTAVAKLSGHQKIGIGNGCAFFSYALFYAIGQFVVGSVTDVDPARSKYHWVSVFLLFLSAAIGICSVVLFVHDRKYRNSKLWRGDQL